jgi:hypothetical protein
VLLLQSFSIEVQILSASENENESLVSRIFQKQYREIQTEVDPAADVMAAPSPGYSGPTLFVSLYFFFSSFFVFSHFMFFLPFLSFLCLHCLDPNFNLLGFSRFF